MISPGSICRGRHQTLCQGFAIEDLAAREEFLLARSQGQGHHMDIPHHFLESLRFQAGSMVGAIHGPVQGDMPFDDACTQRSRHGGNGNAAFVTGISHRHIVFAQLIHIAQIDIFESSRVGAVAVQQGKLHMRAL